MGYIKGIFERATIQGIADYLLFGSSPEIDERSYEERLDEPYKRFEKAVEKYDKNPASELLDTLLIHSMRLRQEQMEQRKNQLLFVLTLQLPLLKEMEKKRTQTEKRALEILSILHLDHLF